MQLSYQLQWQETAAAADDENGSYCGLSVILKM